MAVNSILVASVWLESDSPENCQVDKINGQTDREVKPEGPKIIKQ